VALPTLAARSTRLDWNNTLSNQLPAGVKLHYANSQGTLWNQMGDYLLIFGIQIHQAEG